MRKFAPIIAAITTAAYFAGCAGGGSGVRFSDLFDDSAAAEGTGIQFSGIVRAVVILATHDATARQRQIAEQNGRRAVAKLQTRYASRPEAAPKHKKPRPKKPVASVPAREPKVEAEPKPKHKARTGQETVVKSEPKPEPKLAPEPEPTPRAKPQKKLPRIIAVTTEKDEHTDKKAAKAIMLFDTHAQKIIGNKVYDIQSEPRPGDDVRFETHSASYIGASL